MNNLRSVQRPINPRAVTVADVLSYLQSGQYESGHWLQRALATLPAGHVPEYVIQDISARLDSVIASLDSEIGADSMVLYRGLKSPADDRRPIGQHWTLVQEKAREFGANVYVTKVPIEAVDWVSTVVRRLGWPTEAEITLPDDGVDLLYSLVMASTTKPTGQEILMQSKKTSLPPIEPADERAAPSLSDLAWSAVFAVSDLLDEDEIAELESRPDIEKVRYRYLHADCDDLALALHLALGWDVRAISSERGFLHRLVSDPDGRLLDASGWTTEDDLRARYGAQAVTVSESGNGALACQSCLDENDPSDFQEVAGVLLHLDSEPFVTELRAEIESFARTVGLRLTDEARAAPKRLRP